MKEVILIGQGPSWVDCPFDVEVWGVLSCFSVPELKEKHFDKVFAFDPLDEKVELNLKIAAEQGVTVVSVYPYATEPYPLEEILDKVYHNGYLQNTICHMIAMAILQGYERIRLYGIDQYRGVYLLQKGAVEFWCGLAIGRGIKLEVAPSSMLLTEYLREVAKTIGAGDDEEFASFQQVMPFKIKQPVMPFIVRPSADRPDIPEPKVQAGLTQYAFYDLEVSPLTFDFVEFLALAEKRRQERNCVDLRVVIVPAKERFRKGDLEKYQTYGDYDTEYMEWRLRNILVPCCWLMPSCKGVIVCGDREEAQKLIENMDGFLYPEGYTLAQPVGRFLCGYAQSEDGEMPSLKATPQSLVYVSQWLEGRANGRKVITINLRETVYEPDRNSNLAEWTKFYEGLDRNKYFPIVIRDMEKAFELNGFPTYPEVTWNLELRLALYELSYLNMFVNTGPAELAWYDKSVSSLTFKMVTPTSGATTEEFFVGNGLAIGDQWRHSTPNQRIVWEDDSFEVIHKEFQEMCERIESKDLVEVNS